MSYSTTLKLFVYGTLQRGQCNHERYFGGDAAVMLAQVRGRLVQLRQGYPMLIVPAADVLVGAHADIAVDIAQGKSLEQQGAPLALSEVADEAWPRVQGQIVTLTDAARRLPAIDQLEDFNAASGRGLYQRVAIRTVEPAGQVVWTYVAPDGQVPPGAVAWHSAWP